MPEFHGQRNNTIPGSCGQQGYRSNGSYVEGWHGVCGTGNPYYLLCSSCRDRYLTEHRAQADSADAAERNLPYAKLLLMAPDLLGSVDSAEQGTTFRPVQTQMHCYSHF